MNLLPWRSSSSSLVASWQSIGKERHQYQWRVFRMNSNVDYLGTAALFGFFVRAGADLSC